MQNQVLKNPLRFRHNIVFILCVSIFICCIGFLTKEGILPLNQTFERTQNSKIWFQIAAVIGIALPFFVLIACFKDIFIRKFTLSFLLVLFFQIMSERLSSRNIFPSMILVVAFLYISYRLWQLVYGFIECKNHTFVKPWQSILTRSMLVINLIFWSMVLIRRIVFGLPQLL